MEVITIDSKAYQEIVEKLDKIIEFVTQQKQPEVNSDETWVDSYEICTFLKISYSTLQRYRTKGLLTYYAIDGKVYYKSSDLHEFIRKQWNK